MKGVAQGLAYTGAVSLLVPQHTCPGAHSTDVHMYLGAFREFGCSPSLAPLSLK